MDVDVKVKRKAVADAYKSPLWRDRVDHMTEDQVHAIYRRLLDQGKLKKG